jgi:hypothetical protein
MLFFAVAHNIFFANKKPHFYKKNAASGQHNKEGMG